MRAKQRAQFRAKSAKNDLKPTDFLNRNFYFETEGVFHMYMPTTSLPIGTFQVKGKKSKPPSL